MGTNYLQHRQATGLFNYSRGYKCYKNVRGDAFCSPGVSAAMIFKLFSGKETVNTGNVWFTFMIYILCVFYIYMLCLIMALTVDNTNGSAHCRGTPPPSQHHFSGQIISINLCLDCLVLFILELCACSLTPNFFKLPRFIKTFKMKYVLKKLKKYNKKYSTMSKLSHMYTLWLVSINIILIVIVTPAIVNPGPHKHPQCPNISMFFSNVQGLIPFPELAEPHPKLDNTKLFELQSYVFFNKIDIVILNETWLTKDILSNEIFPDNAYKTYRVDRSIITHPPDPSDPDKYRRNGGGVLISIRSDLNVQSKKIKIDSRAEVLAVELKLSSGKKICVSTCYRVGTLEDENHAEVEKYLKKIANNNKIGKHIVLGDFNLNKTSWPNGTSTNFLETKFLNTFEDIGLTQLIDKPTHIGGKTLDLLLTNTPSFVTNVNILEHKQVCNSDHFGITFTFLQNIQRIKCSKRRIYNYSKANWDDLNNDLKHIKWDHIITESTSTQRSWDIFKNVLFRLCDKHIPKITIKPNLQPPWFDSDIHKICLKKERLRAKFKKSQNPDDYDKFRECRKHFKKSLQEK